MTKPAVDSDGQFPCEVCDKTFKTIQGVRGHQRVHSKVKKEVKEAPPVTETPAPEAPSAPEVKVTEGPSSYPSLKSWATSEVQKKKEEDKREGDVPKVTPGVAKTPVAFETTGLWMTLGGFIDNTIMKNAPEGQKINMTPAKAAVMNSSLAGMGFQTEPPAHAITVPNWAPLMVSALSVFILPIILYMGSQALTKKPPKKLIDEMVEKYPDNFIPAEPEPQPEPTPLTDAEKAELTEKQRRSWEPSGGTKGGGG